MRIAALGLGLLCGACAPAKPSPDEPPPARHDVSGGSVDRPELAPLPSASSSTRQAPEPDTEPSRMLPWGWYLHSATERPLASLEDTDILVQTAVVVQGYSPVMPGIGPHTIVPDFTLYRDGTIIMKNAGEQSLVVHRASPDYATANHKHILALNFADLKSCDDGCGWSNGHGSVSITRVRVGDELREIRNEDGVSEDGPYFAAIYDRIAGMKRETAASETPYAAEWVTLSAARVERDPAKRLWRPPSDAADERWPLSAKLFREFHTGWRRSAAMPADVARRLGLPHTKAHQVRYFRRGREVIAVVAIPWLPGADHRDTIEAANERWNRRRRATR